MSSGYISDDNDNDVKHGRSDSLYPSTHENEQIDGYNEYLAHGDEPEDNSRNPRNLFDEVNSNDTEWLNIARMHLNRNR